MQDEVQLVRGIETLFNIGKRTKADWMFRER